jgi:prepilin-type N-terminal cleavage/methylation domain-containing protein
MQGSDRRGFSLVEALLAIAVLAAIATGVSGLFTFLAGGSGQDRELLTAHLLAQEIMENSLRLGYDGLPVGTATDPSIEGFERFSSRLEVTQVESGLRSLRVTVESPAADESLETLVADRQ